MKSWYFLWVAGLVAALLSGAAGKTDAQALTRDYAIREINYTFSEDQTRFLITVTIENSGAAAQQPADLVVILLTGSQRELGRQTFAPLESGTSTTFSLVFQVADFPPGSEQAIEVAVGLDEFEPPNTPLAADNQRSITIPIPERAFSWNDLLPLLAHEGDTIIVLGMPVSREQFAVGAAVTVAALLFLWLFTVILRLIFRRPARFPSWQPPYALLPIYDQNSLEGRRQAWQQYAQNGLLLAAPVPGNLHPVKLLVSESGRSLGDWKVKAIRLTQYDTYGRIMRSQAIAPAKQVKRLNAVLRKRSQWDNDQLRKHLLPIAKGLVQDFRKHIIRKTAFLPVAFDLRFEGKHGEVRIVFELYQCQQSAWFRIDQWEPVMAVITSALHENYSYTIHGMVSGEKFPDFLKRLQEDLLWLLVETLRETPVQQNQEQVRHDLFEIPDTLAGMEPMRDQR